MDGRTDVRMGLNYMTPPVGSASGPKKCTKNKSVFYNLGTNFRRIFLIKINYLYLDLHFFYIKNPDLQIFQKDQLKSHFKIFARHVLHNINLLNLFVFTTQHHVSNKNLYVNFSSLIFPGSKLDKINENMKISKCCKSSCTISYCFK